MEHTEANRGPGGNTRNSVISVFFRALCAKTGWGGRQRRPSNSTQCGRSPFAGVHPTRVAPCRRWNGIAVYRVMRPIKSIDRLTSIAVLVTSIAVLALFVSFDAGAQELSTLTSADVEHGQRIYRARCARCHG